MIDLKMEVDGKEDKMWRIRVGEGLMINKEDGENEWMMEGVIGKKDREVFEVVLEEDREVKIVVRI
ncbi:YwpF family protein, partial [Bacillus altitudinis]|uniref:YwpF family protein n=1 Tax=Bacillus altitudinis TaxID=293387 RepID=UPI00235679E3